MNKKKTARALMITFIGVPICIIIVVLICTAFNNKRTDSTKYYSPKEKQSYSSDTNEVSNKMQLKKNAYAVLYTISDDERVSDYISAVDILENLPKTKDSFLNELKKVQKITDKYNIELRNMDYFLSPNNSLDNSNDDLYEYISSTSKARKDDLEN